MADDKKNIGPEAEKPGDAPQEKKVEPVKDTPPAPEQPAPGAPEAPVVETAPKAQTTPAVETQPEEKAAPTPKVLDFSAAKNKAPAKEETAPEKKPAKEQAEEKPKRGRPAKTDKAPPKSPSSPETKCPKVRKLPARRPPPLKSRRQHPRSSRLPNRSSPPLPVTLPALPNRSRSSISICPSCIRSKIILSVFVTMTKMIACEAFTYAALGCAVGCGIGLQISKMLYDFLITEHFPSAVWHFPITSLAIILLFVLLAAIAAVYAPAKRIRSMPITATINEL